MKNLISLLFIMINFVSFSQSKTKLIINNPFNISMHIYDEISHDSILFTKNTIDSVTVENFNNTRPLVCFTNFYTKYKDFILEGSELNVYSKEDKTIRVEQSLNNKILKEYFEARRILKDNNASGKELNSFSFNHATEHPNLYKSLSLLTFNVKNNLHSIDSNKTLFNKLDPVLKQYKEWDKAELLLSREYSNIRIGDEFPTMEVIGINDNKVILSKNIKKTIFVFWRYSCGGCHSAVMNIKKYSESFKDYDVVFMNLDITKEKWKKAFLKFGTEDFSNYYIEENFYDNNVINLMLGGTPSSFVLDENYNIIKKYDHLILTKRDSLLLSYSLNKINLSAIQKVELLKNIRKIENVYKIYIHVNKIDSTDKKSLLSEKRAKKLISFLKSKLKFSKEVIFKIKESKEIDSDKNNGIILEVLSKYSVLDE